MLCYGYAIIVTYALLQCYLCCLTQGTHSSCSPTARTLTTGLVVGEDGIASQPLRLLLNASASKAKQKKMRNERL
jgi:hypothetical protein